MSNEIETNTALAPASPVKEVRVFTKHGSHIQLKDAQGRFVKKQRRVKTASDAQRRIQEILENKPGDLPSPEGAETEFDAIVLTHAVNAKRTDLENVGAAPVKSAEFLFKHAFPKEKEQVNKITAIFINLPEVPKAEAHIKETRPSFLDAEIIEQNPAPPQTVTDVFPGKN
jgi:hypothetical protein